MDTFVIFLRRNRWARFGLSGLSLALLLSAAGLLGYPLYTNLYQSRVQSRLDRQFASADHVARYRSASLKVGDALTRIKIPRLGVDVVVVEGTTSSALRAGAGHYRDTPLPCALGNVSIAGHRTTYGKPFANLDRLKPGDPIILETPVGRCTYEISRAPFIVRPDDLSVVANTPTASTLTLTTCHPKGSARQRLIIRATMVEGGEVKA
ncbi:MAG: sortase [Acidimicrobiales bacterium]